MGWADLPIPPCVRIPYVHYVIRQLEKERLEMGILWLYKGKMENLKIVYSVNE